MNKPSIFLIAITSFIAANTHAEISGSGIQVEGCNGQISLKYFADNNSNGRQDSDEQGLADIDVSIGRVSAPELGTDTLKTDATGRALFFNLCLDAYEISTLSTSVPHGMQLTRVEDDDPDLDLWDSSQPLESLIVPLTDAGTGMHRNLEYVFTDTACSLGVIAGCAPPPSPNVPSTPSYQCDKPVEQMTMIWNGEENIKVVAHNGKIDDPVLMEVDHIAPGMEVTIDGYEGSSSDVIWEIYAAGTSQKLGESAFHLSCSDDDMDGPEDCGLPAGDAKNNDKCTGGNGACRNDWLFEGWIDKNGEINCSQDYPTDPLASGLSACEINGPGDVNYQYVLVNNNAHSVEVVSVMDSLLGSLPGIPSAPLQPGSSASFAFSDYASDSLTRQITVTTAEDGDVCTADSSVSVTVNPLPTGCELMDVVLDGMSHDQLNIKYTNNSDQPMLITSVEISWPVEHELLKEVKFSGDALMKTATPWTTATVITENQFLVEPDKRTIEIDKTEKVEFKFDEHVHDSPQQYNVDLEFASGCTVNYTNVSGTN